MKYINTFEQFINEQRLTESVRHETKFVNNINESNTKKQFKIKFKELNLDDIFISEELIYVKISYDTARILGHIDSFKSIKLKSFLDIVDFHGNKKITIPIYGSHKDIIKSGIKIGSIKDKVIRLNRSNPEWEKILKKSKTFEEYLNTINGSKTNGIADFKRIWNNSLLTTVVHNGNKIYVLPYKRDEYIK